MSTNELKNNSENEIDAITNTGEKRRRFYLAFGFIFFLLGFVFILPQTKDMFFNVLNSEVPEGFQKQHALDRTQAVLSLVGSSFLFLGIVYFLMSYLQS